MVTFRVEGNLVGKIFWRISVSMQDPIADMLAIIKNGQNAKHQQVKLVSSKLKEEVVRVLYEEGYIKGYSVDTLSNNFKTINIDLKYYHGKPVIERIKRISRPGLRIYKNCKDLINVPGFGIKILSTSKGVMTHIIAKTAGIGGEVICEVA